MSVNNPVKSDQLRRFEAKNVEQNTRIHKEISHKSQGGWFVKSPIVTLVLLASISLA